MNPDAAAALMLVLIGVVIVLTAFAPRYVPWLSDVEYSDDDIAQLSSTEPDPDRPQ